MQNCFDEIVSLSKSIFLNPELGYKEFETKKKIIKFVKKYASDGQIQEFSTTGLKISLPKVKSKSFHLALVAELDAVYSPSHFSSDKSTGAAHNCGHHAQVGIMLMVLRSLVGSGLYKSLNYNISFIFTPAEEYVDLGYREELIKKGVIKYLGGKPEAMSLGVFDDIDCAILAHSMGGDVPGRVIELGCTLVGFLYKKYGFKGKPAHAGFAPFEGVNAYSMSTLFNTGLGLLRQQLNDSTLIRMNPIVLDANMSTNVICDYIMLGTDIRGSTIDAIIDIAKKLDTLAQGSAYSLCGEVSITTQQGYLPFIQDAYLTQQAKIAYDHFLGISELIMNHSSCAAGDVGDLSYMIPCIQVGFSGFSGTIHGQDFKEADVEYIYNIFPNYILHFLKNLKLERAHLYKRTYKDYELLLSTMSVNSFICD